MKKNKILKISAICMSTVLALSACKEGANSPNSASGVKSAGEVSDAKKALTPEAEYEIKMNEIKNMKVPPDIQKMVVDLISESVKAGKIKKGQYTSDDIMLFAKALTYELQSGNVTDKKAKLVELMDNIGSSLNKDGNVAQFQNVFEGEGSKELGDKILANIKDTKINKIVKLDDSKFYSVYVNNSNNAMFTTKDAKYFILYNPKEKSIFLDANGLVMDTALQFSEVYKDYTSQFDESLLIKKQFGKGERKIYIFSDPDCPFCKKLDNELLTKLNDSDNLTIYYVMNPLEAIHPNALEKAQKIVCADDKDKAWEDFQLKNVLPKSTKFDTNKEECVNTVNKQLIYPQIINLTVTPTIINQNGIMIEGVLDIEQFRKLIDLKIEKK